METWLGYKIPGEAKPCQSPGELFALMSSPPACMVKQIDFDTFLEFNKAGNPWGFKVGQYALSTGSCETEIGIAGPYENLEDAFDEARKKLGVNKFLESF